MQKNLLNIWSIVILIMILSFFTYLGLRLKWEYFEKIMEITQFVSVMTGLIFIILQVKDLTYNLASRQNDLLINYDNELGSKKNEEIYDKISKKEPLLIYNEGSFSENEINSYLGIFHLINNSLNKNLLNKSDVNDNFFYYIRDTYENNEIKNYLKKIREVENDSEIFSGLDILYSKFNDLG